MAAAPVAVTAKPIGRPRSKSATQAILTATRELTTEAGYANLTIEAVAARAKSGKATIYRWWPSKAALVSEAFLANTDLTVPFPDTGSTQEDFRRHLQLLAQLLSSPTGALLKIFVGHGQEDPELLKAFQERFLAPWRDEARQVLLRGLRRGDLRSNLFVEIALDLLCSPLLLSLLLKPGAITPDYVDALCDTLMPGLATKQS
ncbi:MAG: TetR/AcrR family transcriptional regulator [Bryobacteraceae bacterium]